MQTLKKLIQENKELKYRLALAEKWMKREVGASIFHIHQEQTQKKARKHFGNIFEQDGMRIITQSIQDIFGETLQYAPDFTQDRLIDTEIYWYTLQRYPHMDAFPILASYQKILDDWIENILIAPFRRELFRSMKEKNQSHGRDILSGIYLKNYTLSIGRFYQILQGIRNHDTNTQSPESDSVVYITDLWKEKYPNLFSYLISDTFFLSFTELMDREIFSTKRHTAKVTYADAQLIRKFWMSPESIFRSLFYFSGLPEN